MNSREESMAITSDEMIWLLSGFHYLDKDTASQIQLNHRSESMDHCFSSMWDVFKGLKQILVILTGQDLPCLPVACTVNFEWPPPLVSLAGSWGTYS